MIIKPAKPEISPAVLKVLLAMAPALLLLLYFSGWGVLIQLVLCVLSMLSCEHLARRWQGLRCQSVLGDGASLISAVILAMALPSYAPWWLAVISSAFAITLAKTLFAPQRNLLNPAMLGIVFALLAFPSQMLTWPADAIGLMPSLSSIFTSAALPDGWSHATALDALRSNDRLTIDELYANNNAFGSIAGVYSQWLNVAFLLGGLWLIQQRLIDWRAPAGMLGALFVASLVFWNGSGSDSHGSPLLHLFSGATMLCAFFICTEPVTGAHTAKGRLYFGIGVGLITYAIRTWGHYPDGVAFAVLLMNLCVLRLDRLGAKK